MAEKRRIISVMSGMSGLENNRKPPQLYNNENNVLITTTSSKLSKNSKKNLNEINYTKSNMYQAIINPSKNLTKKNLPIVIKV